MFAPGDVRVEEREDPTLLEPTDAIIRVAATCTCGSDLWPYRGVEKLNGPTPMGHEYVGVVEQVGDQVATMNVGDFVVGSFVASDNVCEICRASYQSLCIHNVMLARSALRRSWPGSRWPTVPSSPSRGSRPQAAPLAAGRLPRARHRMVRRSRGGGGPGEDRRRGRCDAVGLMGVLAAKQLGADRIIAMSRHADRMALAREFGATDIVTERGAEGVAKIKELTGGYGAHSVIEAVGTQESMWQAINAARPGGHVGYVGVTYGVELNGLDLFFTGVHLHGGPAPVRRFLPHLIQRIWDRTIDPGKVFDLTLPLDEAADGYKAIDERRATKVLPEL